MCWLTHLMTTPLRCPQCPDVLHRLIEKRLEIEHTWISIDSRNVSGRSTFLVGYPQARLSSDCPPQKEAEPKRSTIGKGKG